MMQPTRLSDMTRELEAADDFHRFFQVEYRRLAQAAYLLTGDHYEADELAQQAMVRIYERWPRVRAMASPSGYLYRTAMNLHRSHLRRLAVRARRGLSVSPPPDPAQVAEARDSVARALAALPAGQ